MSICLENLLYWHYHHRPQKKFSLEFMIWRKIISLDQPEIVKSIIYFQSDEDIILFNN